MTSVNIPDSLVDEFERRGAVCLPGVFAQSWLDMLADGVDKNFADPGPDHTVYTKKEIGRASCRERV